MKTNKILSFIMGIAFLFLFAGAGNATAPTPGEEALFTTSTAPDALILLDLSGSMAWNPPGDDRPYGSTNSCYVDTANCTGTGCSGGFCSSSKSSTTFYASASCTTPDTANCVGSGCSLGFCSSAHSTTSFYAAAACTTPDTLNCKGSGCGRSDGFCSSSIGAATYYAHSSCNTQDSYNCSSDRWDDCASGFCETSHHTSSYSRTCQVACTTTGCTTPCTTAACNVACTSGGCNKSCSRLDIAKRSIFNILDDNNDGTINTSDEGSLGVRIGYMRYYGCSSDDTGGDYSSGCNKLIKAIGTSYSLINTSVSAESASGGTPIAAALNEAKLYLAAHKAADASKNCRQKFIIYITDGSDTFACSGDGGECDSDRYKNRRIDVAKAKELADLGFKIFVIGFGASMPPYLQNTLNWMAYYGGTDNPSTLNSGDTTAYNIPSGSLYPAGVTSCGADTSTATEKCWDSSAPYTGTYTGGWSISNYKASANDPGYLNLSGYAFITTDADALVAAVKTAMNIIREATYSFSQASVQSSRTADENYLYEGSFQPISGDSFWLGHLKKFRIKSDAAEACGVGGICGVGTDAHLCVVGDVCGISTSWGSDGDAGTVLQSRDNTTRTMKTYIGGSQVNWPQATDDWSTSLVTPLILGVTTETEWKAIVGYFRGNPTYNSDNWKLGDVFRSTPITVGTPSVFFDDVRDSNNAFATHRNNHCRSSGAVCDSPKVREERLIVAGANDGQFHAFKTSDGSEAWSFLPPNLLSKLKNIAHATEPTTQTHQYFVDGPVTVADVWTGSGDGTSKLVSEWKTILVFGEGRGSTDRLWSSSTSCGAGLVGNYDSTHTNYCGYYALDITTPLSPAYLWNTGGKGVSINTLDATTQAPYMGDSWSRMMIGKVRYSSGSTVTAEKWVGFIGGGYSGGNCTASPCDTRGKGFFVIDLTDGSVLWSYTLADNTSMVYSMPGQPAILDTDNDGFIDTAYLGDLGGNMWRFTFCPQPPPVPLPTGYTPPSSCNTSNWVGSKFFNPPSIRPIYTSPSTTKDTSGNLWVYWGTGDKTDPTASTTQDYFYAVKDLDRISTYSTVDTLGSDPYDPGSTNPGFRIQLGISEKDLSDSTVFGGVVYFTTFTPSSSTDPCDQGGYAKLYGFKYTTGGGSLPGGARSTSIGSGIPSAPVISLKPGGGTTPDLYVTVSGGGGTGASTSRINMNPPGVSNRTNMLYWLDKRIQ
ncbi:MAG: PilC/PilY family type IV pilus protein [Deltaproteobacteria bacterium]|nr:PilC/PilY family type IV pilus protein [Deltaproteobacteria bacterium]